MTIELDKSKKRTLAALIIITVVVGLCIAFQYQDIFRKQELTLWTPRAKTIADPFKANRNIKLVVVDQRSLDVFAEEYHFQWPVSRQFYVPIIELLNKGGAKAVAFDLIFSESSQFLVADDEAFASAVKQSKVPVIVTTVPYKSGPELSQQQRISLGKQNPTATKDKNLLKFPGAMLPIDPLLYSAQGLASVREDPDNDGIYRRYTLGVSVAGSFIPSIALSVARYSDNNNLDPFKSADNEGRAILNFRGPQGTYKTYSFIDLVRSWAAIEEGKESIINPNEFKDSYVIVGVWAAGLQDLRPIPLDPAYRGVEVHATALDNILSDDFIREASRVETFFITLLFIAAVAAVIIFVDSILYSVLIVLTIFSLFIGVGFGLATIGVWLPMFVPMLGMIGSALICFGYQYAREGKERRFIKSAFKHYVSSSVIDKIMTDPSRLKLGGEKREVTLFFSDIEGFTTVSEKLDPQTLSLLLNRYLTEIASIIMKNGGTVDKYVGDSVVAFWNAPVDDPLHADNAVEAAIQCQQRLASLDIEWQREFGTKIRTRIGIHTGPVSVGNFGSQDRFNYTVIGDAANLASRLEGANKKFGTSILVSEATRSKLTKDIKMRRLGAIQVIGRVAPVEVYEPIDNLTLNSSLLAKFEEAVITFEKGDRLTALKLFSEIDNDSVAEAYLARINSDRNSDLNLEKKSPVWELSEK